MDIFLGNYDLIKTVKAVACNQRRCVTMTVLKQPKYLL